MLSTDEVPESVRPFVHDHNAVLLANHGALSRGRPSCLPLTGWRWWSRPPRSSYVDHIGGGVELTQEQADTLRAKTGFIRNWPESGDKNAGIG